MTPKTAQTVAMIHFALFDTFLKSSVRPKLPRWVSDHRKQWDGSPRLLLGAIDLRRATPACLGALRELPFAVAPPGVTGQLPPQAFGGDRGSDEFGHRKRHGASHRYGR